MTTINTYLFFNNKAEEAFNFYKSVFGGEFSGLSRYKDIPEGGMCGGQKLEENDAEKIMHIALPIGEKNLLMASDIIEGMSAASFVEGNNFSISVNTDSGEEADKIFNALAEGGKTEMPMGDTFWGSYYGMLVDKFGINWMVSFDKK